MGSNPIGVATKFVRSPRRSRQGRHQVKDGDERGLWFYALDVPGGIVAAPSRPSCSQKLDLRLQSGQLLFEERSLDFSHLRSMMDGYHRQAGVTQR